MAGKKDWNVVCVTTGLTKSQAREMINQYAKSKSKIAPYSRSTAAVVSKEGIGRLLQKGHKQIAGK